MYPGRKSFGHDYDNGQIKAGWGYLETGNLNTVISKRNTVGSLNVPRYNIKGKNGRVCMTGEVIIPPFVTIMVKGVSKLTTHSKHKNVVIEPIVGYLGHIATARSYGILQLGVGKLNVCLRNHSANKSLSQSRLLWGEIAVANAFPSLLALALKPTEDDSIRGKVTNQQGQSEGKRELLEKIDLTGLQDWSFDYQKEARELIVEYASIFTMQDVDMGKTSLGKHSIRLMDNTPFKEYYQHIPLSMYNVV